MGLYYKSTRSSGHEVTASQAVLEGLAGDGGLYVPSYIPKLDVSMSDLSEMTYQQAAYEVMKLFLTDFTEDELKSCIEKAYDDKFDTPEIAPVVYVNDACFLELYHGKTIAFKDMALSLLPHLMTTAAKKNGVTDEIVVLAATSGDTGKAALEGFCDADGTRIIVFYPKDGVSPVQERQMVTQKGSNTFVAGIRGNFDDAQYGVKKIFSDAKLNETLNRSGFRLSSANSINIGRLIPQVAYYVYAYAVLTADGTVSDGEPVNFVVPTGNFGNILAAYYAKQMGVPVGRLICASNMNNVLTDFFNTGIYDRNRRFYTTSSPSMDILVSSNLERLIYHISGDDPEKTAYLMKSLSESGKYVIPGDMRKQLGVFFADYATEDETLQSIRELYGQSGYVIDPHTAVGLSVYRKYVSKTGDSAKTVIVSTASPFKFCGTVIKAIRGDTGGLSEFELEDELKSLSGMAEPEAVSALRTAPVRHTTVCDCDDMEQVMVKWLGIM